MQVLDIVKSAAIKSGVVSSFNINDDLPGDVTDMGVELLSHQILPQLNCDRTLDITTTCRMYVPDHNVIELRPLRQPIENFILLGYSRYSSDELIGGQWQAEIDRLYRPGSSNWPEDDFGQATTLAMWSRDMVLMYGTDPTDCAKGSANIDFMPMRVDSVIDAGTCLEYTYLYRSEFERTLSIVDIPGIYCLEEYDDRILIIFKGKPGPKKLILPVPLTIINQDHDHPGTIIAPPKFEKYLIDATAYQLAVGYGVASKDDMKFEMGLSYNLLKKNKPQPLHGMNVAEHLNNTLRRDARRTYGLI